MYILGLGGSLHDFSACLVKEGHIAVAIEEERITRQKHGIDKKLLQSTLENRQVWKYISQINPDTLKKSVEYCLECEKITLDDIGYVITTDSNMYLPYIKTLDNVVSIRHHIAHASSVFFTSDFNDAAILVVDGRGSILTKHGETGYETVSFAVGKSNKIKILDSIINHSIGHFYEDVTLGIGFELLEEGKTMGLSSYGKDTYVNQFRNFVEFHDKGRIIFLKDDEYIRSLVKNIVEENNGEFQVKADLAYAVQKITEEVMLHFVKYLKRLTGLNKLCIAGGVALNSVANGKIYNSKIFDEVYVFPACGDNGLSIGAAMYAAYHLEGRDR